MRRILIDLAKKMLLIVLILGMSLSADGSVVAAGKGDMAYDLGAFQIVIPGGYRSLLTIETDRYWKSGHHSLIKVYETASLEQSMEDREASAGFLFEILSMDEEGYDDLCEMDIPGASLIAVDGSQYYVYNEPTDVQFYRSNGETEEELETWNELNMIGPQLRDDIMEMYGTAPRSETTFNTDIDLSKYFDTIEELDLTEDTECVICKGSGLCNVCWGSGQCSACFGKGGSLCSSCIGMRKCGHCNGKGYYYDGVGLLFGKYKCTYCKGTEDCLTCKNAGKIACDRCGGQGDCYRCNGWGDCSFCHGWGHM